MAEEEEAKTEEGEEAPQEKAPEESGDAGAEEDLPTFTAREIEKMNVTKLKEAALQYMGKIVGVHGMDKGQIVQALKEINGISTEKSRKKSNVDRKAIKARIKALHKERDTAIEDKDRVKLKRARKRFKALRRKLIRSA